MHSELACHCKQNGSQLQLSTMELWPYATWLTDKLQYMMIGALLEYGYRSMI